MPKLSLTTLVLLVLVSCGEAPVDAVPDAPVAIPSDTVPLPATIALDPAVRRVVDGWPEFLNLEDRMESVYQANGPEEVGLILEELAEITKALEESEYPARYDLPSVRSRSRLFRTFLGKTQGALYYRLSYGEPLREFLEAYNTLRVQLNRVESDPLDPTLFDDE